MTDKQPAPVGDCHIVGKAVVPEFSELEGAAKHFQELMLNASMACTGKRLEELTEVMEVYRQASTPSVILRLLRQNAELKAERGALATENAMLKGGPQGFFAYGSDLGYDEFDTAEKAQEAAEGEISYYRGEACDGWSEEVGNVVWGVIMQRATMTGLRAVEEGDNCAEGITEWCDYALLPEIKTPATDAAIAEWKAVGVEEFASWMGQDCQSLKFGSAQWKAAKSVVMRAIGFAAILRKGGAE